MSGFAWQDADRSVLFGAGWLAEAPRLLAERRFGPYELFSTERALATVPAALREAAIAVHLVPPGPVPEAAAGILEADQGGKAGGAPVLVALGGGRVIDTAKAVAGVRAGPSGAGAGAAGAVAAIPTTLSGAPMTAIHRFPAGHQDRAIFVRPLLVIADPLAMTDRPEAALRATAMNSLAHGAEALWGPGANPVAELVALRGAELLAGALDQPGAGRDRAALALGSLLCGYGVDSAGIGVHHVLCQTIVRTCATPHAETNAAVLPASLEAMRGREPEAVARVAAAIGAEPEEVGPRVRELGGEPAGIGSLGVEREQLGAVIEEAGRRLAQMGRSWTPEELAAITAAAW